jgi:hypothetical protein
MAIEVYKVVEHDKKSNAEPGVVFRAVSQVAAERYAHDRNAELTGDKKKETKFEWLLDDPYYRLQIGCP